MWRLNEPRNVIRIIALILFLFALAGPWMFDRIHVPAEYPCSAPNTRLEGDFCGLPMPGIKVVFWFAIPILPFISNLLLLFKSSSRSLQTTSLIFWMLACMLSIPLFVSGLDPQANQLWGLWLYLGLTAAMLCTELVLRLRS